MRVRAHRDSPPAEFAVPGHNPGRRIRFVLRMPEPRRIDLEGGAALDECDEERLVELRGSRVCRHAEPGQQPALALVHVAECVEQAATGGRGDLGEVRRHGFGQGLAGRPARYPRLGIRPVRHRVDGADRVVVPVRRQVLADVVLVSRLVGQLDAEADSNPAGPAILEIADQPLAVRVVGVFVGRRAGHEVEVVRQRDFGDPALERLGGIQLHRHLAVGREVGVEMGIDRDVECLGGCAAIIVGHRLVVLAPGLGHELGAAAVADGERLDAPKRAELLGTVRDGQRSSAREIHACPRSAARPAGRRVNVPAGRVSVRLVPIVG